MSQVEPISSSQQYPHHITAQKDTSAKLRKTRFAYMTNPQVMETTINDEHKIDNKQMVEDSDKKIANQFRRNLLRKVYTLFRFDRKSRVIGAILMIFLLSSLFFIGTNKNSNLITDSFSSGKIENPTKKAMERFDKRNPDEKYENVRVGHEPFISSLCKENKEKSKSQSISFCTFHYPIIDIQDHLEIEELFHDGGLAFEQMMLDDMERNLGKPYPIDHMDATVMKHTSNTHETKNAETPPRTSASAIITRRGYKGGDPNDQKNQDRIGIISPFLEMDFLKQISAYGTELKNNYDNNFLIGIWDGHGDYGEIVAEYSQQNFPIILSSAILSELDDHLKKSKNQPIDIDQHVKQALKNSFLKVDSLVPLRESSGCTSSIALCIGSKVYFANAGDSQTFLASFVPMIGIGSSRKETVVEIHFITRQDKPDLPGERERIESLGGYVLIPFFPNQSSRVMVFENEGSVNASVTALAMSRSFGDGEAEKIGVIADPVLSIIDMEQLDDPLHKHQTDKVFVIVAASDGMLDVLSPTEIVGTLAEAYEKGESYEVVSGRLVLTASKKWLEKGFSYRDDISIAFHHVHQ